MTTRTHPDEIPDTALIARCLEGEEGAWALLVRRYANLVYAIASRSGLSDDEVADTFQAVFVIVWRNLDLLDEPQAFPGWLVTIARREAWRVARRCARLAERTERMAADPTAGVLPSGPPRADELIEQAEGAALVQHAVEALDERCRRMLSLLFWDTPTPSYDVIADRLGLPLGSVGPTRARCLEKLRLRLAEVGFRS